MPIRHTVISRRAAIGSLGACAAWLGSTGIPGGLAHASSGQSTATLAAQWRAMSRVGYGPTPELVRVLQAAPSPRAWALQQVDAAFAASRTPPRLPSELTQIAAPLPALFEGFRLERQARAQQTNDKATAQADMTPARRLAFADPQDPAQFSRALVQRGVAWRLLASSQPQLENPLLARLTEFWFNHLNVYAGKGTVRPFIGHYVVQVARAHALGRFEDLLLASARHPAMLFYLDQVRSFASNNLGGQSRGLNENYARELMELHTLGVDGGYSQADVRELARILTGWTVDPNDASGFRFVARLHDNGSKLLMGQRYPDGMLATGEREGEQAIRWLARQPQTARRISLRLAQFFVSDDPPAALVAQLAGVFQASGGDMRSVVRSLLGSADFWQAENRLFKTPMDFACSSLAAIQGDTPGGDATLDQRQLLLTAGFLAQAGQPVHGWQTPDGYKTDAATWLAPEALTRRADYALAITRQNPDLDYLLPYLGQATRSAIAQEPPALRAGLALASPDFMYK